MEAEEGGERREGVEIRKRGEEGKEGEEEIGCGGRGGGGGLNGEKIKLS